MKHNIALILHRLNKGDFFFTITAEILARSLANFYCQSADRHMKFIIYAILTQRARAENSICHILTNRKRPFFLLANKRARRIMNLVASD